MPSYLYHLEMLELLSGTPLVTEKGTIAVLTDMTEVKRSVSKSEYFPLEN
jgi:hypothetical protein